MVSHSPSDARRRARFIYYFWAILVGLGVGAISFLVGMKLIGLVEPGWRNTISSFLFPVTFLLALRTGDIYGRKRVRDAGFSPRRTEVRVLLREPSVDLDDEKPVSASRQKFNRAQVWFFAASWAFWLALFQFLSGGLSSWDDIQRDAYMALFPAIILWLIYRFFTQDPRMVHSRARAVSRKRRDGLSWSQVVEVEERRTYDFKDELVECHLVFRGLDRLVLDVVAVYPTEANNLIKEVEAKLRGESKISSA